jgi:hypothetical protein
MNKFIHIRSAKFPILPGEKAELVNEGMYGKALALYLQQHLSDRGYDAPFASTAGRKTMDLLISFAPTGRLDRENGSGNSSASWRQSLTSRNCLRT